MDILARFQKKLLPHISRIISATDNSSQFRFVVLASFCAFVVLNVWVQYMYPNTYVSERTNLLSSPFSSNSHIVFGKELYAEGNEKEATKELLLAKQIVAFPKPFSLFVPVVLGAQSEPADLLGTWEQNRTYAERAYQYWKIIVGKRPDYRDAYVTLSMLCAKLDKREEAVMYLKKANTLDPNNTFVKGIAEELEVSL